jgi:murein DD-endopeptidase MepM/ murein hydrolase activator NlpD
VYVVQPGDTLWAIAARSGTTVDAIAEANGLDPNAILPIGRQLVLPGGGGSATVEVTNGGSDGAGLAGGGVIRTQYCSTYVPDGGPEELPAVLRHEPWLLSLQPLFEQWGWHYGVQPSLLEALAWQESGWQEGVVSDDGAVGVGQVLPATATFVEQEIVGEPLSLWSTSDNIRLEAAYVGYLQAHTATTCDTIAAYYEGLRNLALDGVFAMSVPYINDVEYLVPGFG